MRVEHRKNHSPSFCMNDKVLKNVWKLGEETVENLIKASPRVKTMSENVDFTFFSVTRGRKDCEKELWCLTTPRNKLNMNNFFTRLIYSWINKSHKTCRTKGFLGQSVIVNLAAESKKGFEDLITTAPKKIFKEKMTELKKAFSYTY